MVPIWYSACDSGYEVTTVSLVSLPDKFPVEALAFTSFGKCSNLKYCHFSVGVSPAASPDRAGGFFPKLDGKWSLRYFLSFLPVSLKGQKIWEVEKRLDNDTYYANMHTVHTYPGHTSFETVLYMYSAHTHAFKHAFKPHQG